MDLISVIMPFYKKREYFKQSLLSAINQTYRNIEIIIIFDDNSKSDIEFIQNFLNLDKRIKFINNEKNLGAAISRNKGIETSKGDYVAFLDCDDYWEKDKLEKQYNFMMDNKILFSHTTYQIVNEKNEIIGKNKIKKQLNYNDLINSCDIGLSTVLLKKEILSISKFKKIKTKEDYALWLELSRNGVSINGLDEPLTYWRVTKNSLSGSFLTKVINGFKVYNKFEKNNLFKSLILVINLGLHYLKKRIKQKIK